MILRELYEANGKTAVIAFGRMNPPTIGHKKLVDKMEGMPGDHYVFLSHTQDAKKNPLSFDEKVRFAKASFGSHVIVGNEGVKTIIQAMQKIESLGYTDVIYVAGSDRVAQFEKLLNDYNGKDYTFQSIKIENAGERDPDADGAEGMSASKMRSSALEGNFEDYEDETGKKQPGFKSGVANPSIAQDMYDTIRKNMGVNQDESITEYVGPIIGALKYGKYAFKIAKWIYKNKWSIAFFTAAWKTIDWIGDAIAWAKRFLDHPITQALGRYGLPAVALAVALYGGRKLYMQLIDMEREGLDEKEMKKRLAEFEPDTSEIQAFEKEMEDLIADTKESYGSVIDDLDLSEESKQALKLIKQHNEESLEELNLFKNKQSNNGSVKEQDPNKMKVLDWIADRVDGKEHFLSFYRKGAAWSGKLLFIRPDAAKKFINKFEEYDEYQNEMKQALTSVQTTSTLFKRLDIKHEIRRAT